jgi:hypothetical protein
MSRKFLLNREGGYIMSDAFGAAGCCETCHHCCHCCLEVLKEVCTYLQDKEQTELLAAVDKCIEHCEDCCDECCEVLPHLADKEMPSFTDIAKS